MSEPNAPDDPSAEDLGELYRRAQQPVPPGGLGDEIRQAARDALHASAPRATWPWRNGVAVAAVLALSVSVLLLFPREDLRMPGEAVLQAPPSVGDVIEPATPAVPAAEAPVTRDVPPAPALEPRREAVSKSKAKAASPPAVTRADEAEQPSVGGDAGENDVLERSYYRSSPELWISHIERLLSEGRFADATREFDEFQARYPQHPYAVNR